MQAEYGRRRGNGFIISPTGTAIPPQTKKTSENRLSSDKISEFKDTLSTSTKACATYAKKASKQSVKTLFSVTVAICCLLGIFNFFTFASGIYIDGNRIAVVHKNEDFITALDDAKAIASSYGIKSFTPEFSTYPVVTLNTKTDTVQSLTNKILLSSDLFVEGCSLYVDGNKIFDAESASLAHKATEEYISAYSMNGNGELSSEPQYITCIIPKECVMGKSECIRLLEENNNVNVVSIVNSTSQEVVPFETYTENDSTMYVGDSVTVTEGKNGNMQILRETIYENGKEHSVRIASEKITAQPISQVVRIGTKYKKVLESGLSYPLEGVLSSPFGERWGRKHEGIDIAVAEGTPVKAAECGTVTRVSENAGGYGKLIEIDHGYDVETIYAHLSKIQVTEGQSVSSGTVIGLSGNTGRSTGPHLHFEIVKGGTPVDPLKHLKQQ